MNEAQRLKLIETENTLNAAKTAFTDGVASVLAAVKVAEVAEATAQRTRSALQRAYDKAQRALSADDRLSAATKAGELAAAYNAAHEDAEAKGAAVKALDVAQDALKAALQAAQADYDSARAGFFVRFFKRIAGKRS